MDQHFIVYLLIALLCILAAVGFAYFAELRRQRTRDRQRRVDRQADRERLAAMRIADNGGKALSSKFATPNGPAGIPERRI